MFKDCIDGSCDFCGGGFDAVVTHAGATGFGEVFHGHAGLGARGDFLWCWRAIESARIQLLAQGTCEVLVDTAVQEVQRHHRQHTCQCTVHRFSLSRLCWTGSWVDRYLESDRSAGHGITEGDHLVCTRNRAEPGGHTDSLGV